MTAGNASQRCTEVHRRLEHAVTLAALNRHTGREAASKFPEGPCIPPSDIKESEAILRACLGMLRKHREEIDALKEQMAEIQGREAVA